MFQPSAPNPQAARGAQMGRSPVLPPQPGPFYSIAETARMLGTSEMTLYRAIAAGKFPAVRIRGRLIVPARAIQAMIDAAVETGGVVDAGRP